MSSLLTPRVVPSGRSSPARGYSSPVVVTPRAGPWSGRSVTRSPMGPAQGGGVAHDGDPGGAHLSGDRHVGVLGPGEQQEVGEQVVEPPAVPAEHVDASRARAPGRRRGPARDRWRPWRPGAARATHPPRRRSPAPRARPSRSRPPRGRRTGRGASACSTPESAAITRAPSGRSSRWVGSTGSPPVTTTTMSLALSAAIETIPSAGITRFRFLGRWRCRRWRPPSQPGSPSSPSYVASG